MARTEIKQRWGHTAPLCQWRNGPYACEKIQEWWDRLESWSHVPSDKREEVREEVNVHRELLT